MNKKNTKAKKKKSILLDLGRQEASVRSVGIGRGAGTRAQGTEQGPRAKGQRVCAWRSSRRRPRLWLWLGTMAGQPAAVDAARLLR